MVLIVGDLGPIMLLTLLLDLHSSGKWAKGLGGLL